MGTPRCKQLVSSIFSLKSQQLEKEITDAVSEFFEFAMLSHRWGDYEQTLYDIQGKRIYDLDSTDGLAKLQKICVHSLERNFQWAWSDTCCIDKHKSTELQETFGPMFCWYRQSSLTIIYLSDISGNDSLANGVWFKRGWTLLELLASRTVLFYTHDWSPYMNRDATNHKADPALLEELHGSPVTPPERMAWISKRHGNYACVTLHHPSGHGGQTLTSPSRYIYEIHASRLRPIVVTTSVNLGHNARRYILVRPWHPKLLGTRTYSNDEAVWNLLGQLEQPFNALLLKALLHNEYTRIHIAVLNDKYVRAYAIVEGKQSSSVESLVCPRGTDTPLDYASDVFRKGTPLDDVQGRLEIREKTIVLSFPYLHGLLYSTPEPFFSIFQAQTKCSLSVGKPGDNLHPLTYETVLPQVKVTTTSHS
ncbi:hypothetical protein EDC04DRAFT_2609075 [Pisolithus marmoratus]|nr:hypothetical protein EDC04DRAFT_2609075 [Pisolithus marmoratus]